LQLQQLRHGLEHTGVEEENEEQFGPPDKQQCGRGTCEQYLHGLYQAKQCLPSLRNILDSGYGRANIIQSGEARTPQSCAVHEPPVDVAPQAPEEHSDDPSEEAEIAEVTVLANRPHCKAKLRGSKFRPFGMKYETHCIQQRHVEPGEEVALSGVPKRLDHILAPDGAAGKEARYDLGPISNRVGWEVGPVFEASNVLLHGAQTSGTASRAPRENQRIIDPAGPLNELGNCNGVGEIGTGTWIE
jgi:hypothetical protein